MPKPPLGIMVDTMDIPDTMDIMVMDTALDMVTAMVWDMDTDLDTDMLILMDTLIMVKCLSDRK